MGEDLRGNAKITRVSSHADLGSGEMGTDARELGVILVSSVHANGRERVRWVQQLYFLELEPSDSRQLGTQASSPKFGTHGFRG